MMDMATLGAQVLHNRSVGLAKKYGVKLVVRSSLSYEEGTLVKEDVKVETRLISGVAIDKSPARISLIALPDVPGIAFKVFDLLSRENINKDIILQSVGRDGTKDISFTVDKADYEESLKILEENLTALNAQRVESEYNVAKVSVVGAGMMTDATVASKMFEALYNADINIKMISTSEIRITVLVDERDAEHAAQVIHDAFIPE